MNIIMTNDRAAEVLGIAVSYNGCGRATSDELRVAVKMAQEALREHAAAQSKDK